MAIIVSTNGEIIVAGTNLSDHCTTFTLDDGQETKDITTFTTGTPIRVFRAGLGTPSVQATFKLDHAAGSVEPVLRPLVSTSSTGFALVVQKLAAGAVNPTSSVNPKYSFGACVLDGGLTVLNEQVGEVAEVQVRFVPYASSLTISTTATS
jgi:hypothetical protein